MNYDISISWERKDPLLIVKIAPGTYVVSYTDNCKFAVRSLTVDSGLAYTTQLSDDSLTLLLKPVVSEPAISESVVSQSVVSKTKGLKCRHQNTSIKRTHSLAKKKTCRKTSSGLKVKIKNQAISQVKPIPKLQVESSPINNPKVLMHLKTTHPYHSEIVISDDK